MEASRKVMAAATSLTTRQEQVQGWGAGRGSAFGLPVPNFANPVTIFGSMVAPAYGTQGVILTYQVKPNWFAVLSAVVLQFAGTGPAPLPGDVNFAIDVDRALGTLNGYPEKDYAAVPWPLGSFTGGPQWPVNFKHKNGETIRIKATPIANMGVGAGNFLYAALIGFEWPQQGNEQ
jgi:hypothetical protein